MSVSLNFWRELVGPQVAYVSRIREIGPGDSVLWVTVDSEAWAEELRPMTRRILDKLHAAGMTNLRAIQWITRRAELER